MVVTTNAVGDPSIENKWGSLLHQQVRLKKIIVRITWVRYGARPHYQAHLTKWYQVAVAASRGSIRRDNAARLTRVEHLINGAR